MRKEETGNNLKETSEEDTVANNKEYKYNDLIGNRTTSGSGRADTTSVLKNKSSNISHETDIQLNHNSNSHTVENPDVLGTNLQNNPSHESLSNEHEFNRFIEDTGEVPAKNRMESTHSTSSGPEIDIKSSNDFINRNNSTKLDIPVTVTPISNTALNSSSRLRNDDSQGVSTATVEDTVCTDAAAGIHQQKLNHPDSTAVPLDDEFDFDFDF
mmetsp:Transcript_20645/g.20764  ORF Transcript_20645/g.20764 Transcript_20645/m.20764 type:complete len:213 (-) Transcript_20645:80-718(-)